MALEAGTATAAAAAWTPAMARRLGEGSARSVDLAEEVPVAFSYGGVAHAVMMATPRDLTEFAVGFTITDGIAGDAAAIRDIVVEAGSERVSVDITLTPVAFQRFLQERRRRSLRGHSSCGVCGVEGLEDVPVVARRLAPGDAIGAAAIGAAVAGLREWQPLSRVTRAAHAAVAVRSDGTIALGREDVGRHNALDKLIGAAALGPFDWACGFCLITSRCSFEMVQKAAAAGIPTLVALSAPTALAVRLARDAGLALVAFAAGDEAITFAS